MESLSDLKNEHSIVLQELYALDRQLGWLESSGPGMTRKILVLLLSGGEKLGRDLSFHFQKEEKTLYAVLERRMAEKGETVAIMKQEHVRLSACLNKFNAEVARVLREHDRVKTWELTTTLQDLRSNLSDHISREERVLFWLAELHLSKSDKNKVSSELAQMRSQDPNLLHEDSRRPFLVDDTKALHAPDS